MFRMRYATSHTQHMARSKTKRKKSTKPRRRRSANSAHELVSGNRRSFRAVVVESATIIGCVLGVVALLAFWPRVSVTIRQDPDLLVWEYAVKNDSLLIPLTHVRPKCDVLELRFQGMRGQITNSTLQPTAANEISDLPANQQHAFQCTGLYGEPMAVAAGSRIAVDVRYRYLLLNRHLRSCFELSAPRNGSPVWLQRVCN